jgi:hypothetical protein
MENRTYRYLLTETNPQGVTADELLFSFDETDIGEPIHHEVYSLKQYPDRSKVLLISTIAAVVTASIALLMMNFSRSGRTVDESRAWLKRICITWCILNGLGFIMAYVTPFFSDGKWTGG